MEGTLSRMNTETTRSNFVDSDGVRWISVASAMVKYKLDPENLKFQVTQGEVKHRCIAVNDRSVHYVEETKILTRLGNDNGSSWLKDFFNIGLAAASGAVANQVLENWIQNDDFPPTQVSSVLSRFVSQKLLEQSETWPGFNGKYYDPYSYKLTKLIPMGQDLSYLFAEGSVSRFSTRDFLAYARFKKVFHIFTDGVNKLGLSDSVENCGTITCGGQHYFLKNGFFNSAIPYFLPDRNEAWNQQMFAENFVRYIAVSSTSTQSQTV